MKYFISEVKYVFNELLYNESVQEDFYVNLKAQGYCVIKDFLSTEDCAVFRNLIDSSIEKYDCQVDDSLSDFRVFGIDLLEDTVKDVFSRPILKNIYEKYISRNHLNSFIMANRVTYKEGNKGSGGGWHRDSINRRQLKFIVYLSNVDESNGCFQYMPKSQKVWGKLEQNRSLNKGLSEHRYTEEEIDSLQRKGGHIEELTGPMGTLIVADTSGIHRGSPIAKGVRYAMTNYMFDHKIPEHVRELLPK